MINLQLCTNACGHKDVHRSIEDHAVDQLCNIDHLQDVEFSLASMFCASGHHSVLWSYHQRSHTHPKN
jgi:hypothetical protein